MRPHNRALRAVFGVASAFLLVAAGTSVVVALAWPVAPVNINVRWAAGVTDVQRDDLERRFSLTGAERTEGSTWRYQLVDASTANIRALIQDARIEDTAHFNRARFRPEFSQDRTRQIVAYSFGAGLAGAVLWLLAGQSVWRAVRASRPPPGTATLRDVFFGEPHAATEDARHDEDGGIRIPNVVWFPGLMLAAAVTLAGFASASMTATVVALLSVYLTGYVAGSLLVVRQEGAALAIIRTTAG